MLGAKRAVVEFLNQPRSAVFEVGAVAVPHVALKLRGEHDLAAGVAHGERPLPTALEKFLAKKHSSVRIVNGQRSVHAFAFGQGERGALAAAGIVERSRSGATGGHG